MTQRVRVLAPDALQVGEEAVTGTAGSTRGNASVFALGASPSLTQRAAERARDGVAAVGPATTRLVDAVAQLDDAATRGQSRLPGWTRAHVISHLARNADGLVNLLTWARTGVEHPMYASRADRDADIAEGSARPHRLLSEDLVAASQRFAHAAETLADAAWTTRVANLSGATFFAAEVPWMRVREVWLHLVDLDIGCDVRDVPAELVEIMLDNAVQQLDGRADVPPLEVEAELPGGGQRSWVVNASELNTAVESVRGDGRELLGWLTGRGSGTGLDGALPALPPWA
jgi:maleylpyruvate isomerase